MQESFYKIIKNNFTTISSFCILILLLCNSTSVVAKPERSYAQREYAFDVTTAFNEYKRYYWHYPNSKELFLTFAENYIEHFWNDLTYREKANSTWYQSYKKIKSRKEGCQIATFDKYCLYTDYTERQNLVFADNLCEDCRLDKMSVADFKRRYSLCAFDCNGNILWDKSESINQLYIQIQQYIRNEQTSVGMHETNKVEMILFKYKQDNDSIALMCESEASKYMLLGTIKEGVRGLLKDYCSKNTCVSEINMYVCSPL